ncbi:MAG: polyribonucleotide nucleotidyltransferase [Candidatus Andersenbacteria bacterium CG10_big_fil_rev_8_21_14_0_10_54_11]|uniref:Polyribonucleotide nucleotidyltransferase n=1 Tax=Candidatus Andersenbacteria bacterium CG10_big_fil_rev_8_21_14_0_10_54_11 TaxID=1974485 RepID=A0A2M6WZ49_9BACT|nr:MAG: polyribonucleotide nucleotidyltransferase [Candidatus Andersenbacteria bacterium CG10_big_fil_rev_8_21_14_0_10_54_11]
MTPSKKTDAQQCIAQIGGQELYLETGLLAKQAGGSILVKLGETVVLGTATMGNPLSPDADWMPLLVDYEEKFYAAGKIKGSRFIKREGRPTDDAILNARLIDRAIRPLFPDDVINNIQIVITVLSYDGENDPDVPAMIAAAGALMLSDVPWAGPLAGVRIGRLDGKFTVNPTTEERESSELDLFVAGTADRITMIEAGANEIPEDTMLDALEEAQKALGLITPALGELQRQAGKEKREPTLMKKTDPALVARIQELARDIFVEQLKAGKTKDEIGQAERDAYAHVITHLPGPEKEQISEKEIRGAIHALHADYFRQHILENNWRADGRALDEVRALQIKAGILPRTHGSGLFQRGDTQVLTVVTLGGPSDVLLLDTMEIEAKKRYIHYYNFPAFSVGEIKPARGPGRREIGHGALAERALIPVLPPKENWPYTMLLVSEVLESHGSSSMASVCGSTLALMDAGVPITKPVAGIAMGLVSSNDEQGAIDNFKVLTDIAGIEDEKGDMDFKVAGTQDGITALQMDIKVTGLNREILAAALAQAREARLHILKEMAAVLPSPRPDLSPYAPRIEVLHIPVEKIGDLIGPKGKHINEIIEQTGVEIDIEDDGMVSITSNDAEAMEKAKEWVHNMTREIKAGERFEGKVTRIMDFGAFVEILPGTEGMVHISQFREDRIDKISDVVKVGDIIPVVVVEIDHMGRINLSHKAAVSGNFEAALREETERKNSRPSRGDRGGGRGGQRGNSFRGPSRPGRF